MAQDAKSSRQVKEEDHPRHRYRFLMGSSLFLIFFVFYTGVAVLVTPPFKAISGIPVAGLPLGLVLSLLIFPLSWVLAYIYFKLWR